jgi:hypothetical protein
MGAMSWLIPSMRSEFLPFGTAKLRAVGAKLMAVMLTG